MSANEDDDSSRPSISPARHESGLVIRFLPVAAASSSKQAGGDRGGAFTEDDADPPRRSMSQVSWRSGGNSGEVSRRSYSRHSRRSPMSAEDIGSKEGLAASAVTPSEYRGTTHDGAAYPSRANTRRARIRLSDLRSSREHLWLVRHEVGHFADITAFSTVQQFAEYAHETLQAEADPSDGDCMPTGVLGRAQAPPLSSTTEPVHDHVGTQSVGAHAAQLHLFTQASPDLLDGTITGHPTTTNKEGHPRHLRAVRGKEMLSDKPAGDAGGPASPSHRYAPLNVRRGKMCRSSGDDSSDSSSSRSCRSHTNSSRRSTRSPSTGSSSSSDRRRHRSRRHGRGKHRRHHHSSSSEKSDNSHRRRRRRNHHSSSSSSSTSHKSRKSRRTHHDDDDDTSASSRSSSSSSSTSSDLNRSFWVDLQTSSASAVKRVLELFPLHAMTIQEVLRPQSTDIIEAFTAHNYVFVNVLCQKLHPSEENAQDSPGAHHFRGPVSLAPVRCHRSDGGEHRTETDEADHYGDSAAVDASRHVVVSAIVFEDWILTIHREPFQGLSEVFLRLKIQFGLGRSQRPMFALRSGEGIADVANNPQADDFFHRAGSHHLMSSAWVLATCLEFVTESFLPDPTVALAEVDSVDEMVLLVGSEQYKNDQTDLLLRIAMLRRKISSQRASLFHKEQFIQQMLMPAIRTTFVSKHSGIHEHYKHTLSQVAHVAQRLDAARDILNQANSNFISNITMNMSQSSTRMNLKMQLLTQVATIFLPLNLVAGIFGMNVEVPFQNDSHTSLTAFFVILGCMGAWFLLMSPQLVTTFRLMRKEDRDEALLRRVGELETY